jgi:hypothetical protein
VATSDPRIELDTRAFGRARRRRTTLRVAYWLLLVAAAAAVAAILSAAAGGAESPRKAAEPAVARSTKPARTTRRRVVAAAPPGLVAAGRAAPARRTPVAVWNGFGRQGAASAMAARLTRLGYPLAAVGNAPTAVYRRTLVLYTPGQAPAAVALARKLDLPRAAVGPLDGVRPATIRPARLLVILGG